jgi:hypothetical protein
MASSSSALFQPLDTTAASKLIDHVEHLLFVDRPFAPSARARAATANAEAVRLVCATVHRDEAIRLDTPRGTWLASTELDASAVTALLRSTARSHGVAPRHMLTVRDLSEEVIADALRSPRLDTDERDRIIVWARSLVLPALSADLRHRSESPRSAEATSPSARRELLWAFAFMVVSLSVIVPGSLGVISVGVTSPGGLVAVGTVAVAALGALFRQLLIARRSDANPS